MKMVDKSTKLDKFSANMSVGTTVTGGTGINISGVSGTSGLPAISGGCTAAVGGVCGGSSGHHHYQKPVPMKLFAAWEVDRTPPNCIPRLCSLTITRLSIMMSLPCDMTSLSLAVKMQSSKRTLRSHEIPINISSINANAASNIGACVTQSSCFSPSGGGGINNITSANIGLTLGNASSTTHTVGNISGNLNLVGNNLTSTAMPFYETELDLHFSLQYPHFIKRDGNRLVILLQRRKKYKSRTILGYKTLAEGIVRMDAVLQKSMDMKVELTAAGKNGRPGTIVACLRAERVCSIPVDHDNKNNNSVLLADRVAEYSDDDEEAEFSSGEFNDEVNELGYHDPKREYNPAKHDMRKYRKQLQRTEVEDGALGTQPVDSDSEFEMKDKSSSRAKISRTISLQQRNFKQKIVALLKRFRASEELEGEVNRGNAALRGERDLDAFFQELESLSCCEGDDSGPDMDSLSIGSTPKPSLRPFFTHSRIMLHENNIGGKPKARSLDKGEQIFNNSSHNVYSKKKKKYIDLTNSNNNNSATTPEQSLEYRNDSSGNEGNALTIDGQISDTQNSPPRGEKDIMRSLQQQLITPAASTSFAATPPTNEKRSRLFRTSSNTTGSSGYGNVPSGKKKQTLSLSAEPRSVLETCLSPTNVEPRKILLDQLSRAFASEDAVIPEVVTLIGPPEAISGSAHLSKLTIVFANSFKPAFLPQNTAEVKAVLQALMGKIQKYCNSNAKPPNTVKILLIGGDWLQGATLRHYVELMGVRPPDWLNHLRFYIIPIGNCTVARYLSQVDQTYAMMFGSENWYQLCDRAAVTIAAVSSVPTVNATMLSSTLGDVATGNMSDLVELVNRIQRYLFAAGPCTQIPIAEAMVNYKDEDSCQIFVPFVSDVRIGYLEGPHASLDLEEGGSLNPPNQIGGGNQGSSTSSAIPIGNNNSSTNLVGVTLAAGMGSGSGSPPQGGRVSPPLQTPPSSASLQRERGGDMFGAAPESVELQVDYWPIMRHSEHNVKEKSITRSNDQGGKNSIKSTFRNLQVWRLPQNAQMGEINHGLTVCFATKEKKQKQIMRLGKKKEKDRDLEKEQCVEGVARLICSPKPSHPVPLRVNIDGTEWTGVKFFQLSSQWQTHVKNFPIALIGMPMSCSEIS